MSIIILFFFLFFSLKEKKIKSLEISTRGGKKTDPSVEMSTFFLFFIELLSFFSNIPEIINLWLKDGSNQKVRKADPS